MVESLLDGSYRGVELIHVRMRFSRDLSETGRLSLRKLVEVVAVIARVAAVRLQTSATVLYYPPAGDDRLPLARDIAILLSTRWLFDQTIFHFHAGGVSEAWAHLPRWARPVFRRALFQADVGIRTSPCAPPDPARLLAQREFVIANGVEDGASGLAAQAPASPDSGPPAILFVGLLRQSKGVVTLLEACAKLRRRGVPFRLDLVGEYHSPAFARAVAEQVRQEGLGGLVRHHGVLVGERKRRVYAQAAVLAFPTFFESETFGLVLVEAMQFSLPVVATRWRGIPSVVEDGASGYLVAVRDSDGLADRLGELLTDRALRERLGRRGRELYEQRYTLAHFHRGMQQVFDYLSAERTR